MKDKSSYYVSHWSEVASEYNVENEELIPYIVNRCKADGYDFDSEDIEEVEDYVGENEMMERLTEYLGEHKGIMLEVSAEEDYSYYIKKLNKC